MFQAGCEFAVETQAGLALLRKRDCMVLTRFHQNGGKSADQAAAGLRDSIRVFVLVPRFWRKHWG